MLDRVSASPKKTSKNTWAARMIAPLADKSQGGPGSFVSKRFSLDSALPRPRFSSPHKVSTGASSMACVWAMIC